MWIQKSIASLYLFRLLYLIPCLIHGEDIDAASTAAEKKTHHLSKLNHMCSKNEGLRMLKMFHQNVAANKLRNQVLIIGRFRY